LDSKGRDGKKKTSNWTLLKEASDYSYTGLDISEDQTPEAHFEILEKITGVISSEDDLILDITHSFRSIPMVALTAAFYLKATQKVKSLKIYYGAFEWGSTGTTPIHELTSLLDIMEWVNAAQVFQRFGDGSDFARLLKEQHGKAWRDKETSATEKPRTLQNYATKLIEASQALAANQPKAIMDAAQSMQGLQDNAQEEISTWAKPFASVFDDVHAQLSDFADLDLTTQKRLLHWYADRGRLVEAAQLAREWLVTYTARHLGIMDDSEEQLFEKGLRKQAEDALGACYKKDYKQSNAPLSELSNKLYKSPLYKKIMAATGDFIETRNTLSHCGFNDTKMPVSTLKKKIQSWVNAIDDLPTIDQ
jgi:CRISPR-associated DxTHG motif protein